MTVWAVSYVVGLGVDTTGVLNVKAVGATLTVVGIWFAARLSDRFGRKPVMLAGILAGAVLAYPIIWLLEIGTLWSFAIALFIANGLIQGDVELRQSGVVYREPALLLRNAGGGQYQDVTSSSGPALRVPRIGRGAAWGDIDDDGRPDILLTTNRGDPDAVPAPEDGRPVLLLNDNRTGSHWLRVELQGVQSSRDAYGARVRLRIGDRTLTQMVKASSSYLSQSDRRLLFGLGRATRIDSLEIQWPSGQVQTLGATDVDRSLRLREGSPAPVAERSR